MPTQSGIWNLKQVRDGIAGALYVQQPLIDSITGDIGGVQSTLTISGVAFGLLEGTVRFTSGATIADVTVTPASDVSMTVNVPQAIYDLATGSTVGIKFITGLGVQSNTFNKTVSNFAVSFLVIAGGGSGGHGTPGNGGGGGAGGYRSSVSGESSGGLSPSETPLAFGSGSTATVTIGAGGASVGNAQNGNKGFNSLFSTITSEGGGYGSHYLQAGGPGGSGGGAGQGGPFNPGGTATANQGFDGGSTPPSGGNNSGCGGGGAGEIGETATLGSGIAGDGGDGISSSITGSAVPRGGGGGGSGHLPNAGRGLGGNGGGGDGQNNRDPAQPAVAGSVNTGGGGGGTGEGQGVSGAGGSGVVIIKYPDTVTVTNSGGGLVFSTPAAAGGFKVTTFTSGTGTIEFN